MLVRCEPLPLPLFLGGGAVCEAALRLRFAIFGSRLDFLSVLTLSLPCLGAQKTIKVRFSCGVDGKKVDNRFRSWNGFLVIMVVNIV